MRVFIELDAGIGIRIGIRIRIGVGMDMGIVDGLGELVRKSVKIYGSKVISIARGPERCACFLGRWF